MIAASLYATTVGRGTGVGHLVVTGSGPDRVVATRLAVGEVGTVPVQEFN